MRVFADTSAFYAYLDKRDEHHSEAKQIFFSLLQSSSEIYTSNYAIVETISLVQRRLGFEAVKGFVDFIIPFLDVHFVDEELHLQGMETFLNEGKRNLSVVDCTSFVLMKQLELRKVFAFDKHFEEQGFELVELK
jgi:predicted nucleic acid-binding protein